MHPSLSKVALRSGAALTAALVALGVGLAPASAHVRVKPDTTGSGSYAGLTFRVPNESDTASTTKVVLTLPQDRPLANVSIRPVPGWTASVVEAVLPTPVTVNDATLTKAPRTVTWMASSPSAAIGPGQYQEFSISAGPLPSPGLLLLPVSQSYSDGEVVKWDQPVKSGQDEPEHPAPQFEVTPAAGTPSTTGSTAGAGVTPAPGSTPDGGPAAAASGQPVGAARPDGVARVLAGAALAVGLVAIGLTLVGRHRREGSPQ